MVTGDDMMNLRATGSCWLWVAVVALMLACPLAVEAADPPTTQAAQRLLFLGNSITRHGPKPDIGWTGNWGMAASAIEKDYVHVLASALAERSKSAPQVMVENIADFERKPEGFDYKARLEKPLAFKANVIVVAIGENVGALRTAEAKAAFQEHFRKLLAALQVSDRPAIFVRSCFWPDAAKDQILKQVATEAGATFVDISALGKEPANKASAERKIDHAGVAAHPGDKGMKAIAELLLKAMDERTTASKDAK